MQMIGNDIGIQFKKVIENQIDSALRFCHDTQYSRKTVVRELRRNIKNARSVFKLFKPLISEAEFHTIDSQIRNINQLLTRPRESSVNLKTYRFVEQLLPMTFSAETNTKILNELAEHFNNAYSNYNNAFDKIILNTSFQLSMLRDKIHALESKAYTENILYLAIEKTFAKTTRLFKNSKKLLQTSTIHKWRVYNKHLIAQIQFLSLFYDNLFDKLVGDLEMISAILGVEHDLAILNEFLQDNLKDKLNKDENTELQRVVDNERRKLQKRAFSIGNVLFSTRMNIPQTENVTVL
jgi:CHAD domain-containing protein